MHITLLRVLKGKLQLLKGKLQLLKGKLQLLKGKLQLLFVMHITLLLIIRNA